MDLYRSWFLKADGSWTRNAAEAERFPTYDAAFARSAERHNRYPVWAGYKG